MAATGRIRPPRRGGIRPASRRWVLVGVLLWAVLVAGLGYHSYQGGGATDREQTTIGQALPTLDAALGAAAAAVPTGAGAIPVLSGYRLIDADCRISMARRGVRYERVLDLYLRPDGVPALIDAIATGLPARYRALVAHTGTVHRLTADAGNFVAVRAAAIAPGQVRVTADTGCRQAERAIRVIEPVATETDRAAVRAVLAALGAEPAGWRSRRVACPGLEPLWTVEAVTRGRPALPPAEYPAVLAATAGNVVPRLSAPDVHAYRAGAAAIAVRIDETALTVTATTGCRG